MVNNPNKKLEQYNILLHNTQQRYGRIAKFFHWLIAILIICMLIAGFTMINMQANLQKWQIYSIHKATGLVVLILVFLRFIWRAINIKVDYAANIPNWMRLLANISHKLLYMMMFAMPISGIGMSLFAKHEISFYGLFIIKPFEPNFLLAKFLASIHFYSAILLVFLISIHIAAALFHHFILKDNTLRKITSD